MTTTETAPADTEAPTLTEIIAQQLNSMHIIGDRLVKLHATPGENHIALDITHPFPPRSHMRVLLHLGEPVSFGPDEVVDAEIVDDGVEIDAQEGVEIEASA